MFSTFEKTIAFIANCVAILGFVLAALGWLGVIDLPAFTPRSDRVVKALLIVYCLVSTFGVASMLRNRLNDLEQPVTPIAMAFVIFGVPYCFSVAYLTGSLSGGLSADQVFEVQRVAFYVAWFAFAIASFLIGNRITYRRGFFAAMFSGGGLVAISIVAYAVAAIPWMLTEFGMPSLEQLGHQQ